MAVIMFEGHWISLFLTVACRHHNKGLDLSAGVFIRLMGAPTTTSSSLCCSNETSSTFLPCLMKTDEAEIKCLPTLRDSFITVSPRAIEHLGPELSCNGLRWHAGASVLNSPADFSLLSQIISVFIRGFTTTNFYQLPSLFRNSQLVLM